MRRSGEDDILPLFEPIKTQSGTLITQIPLPEGTNVVLALATYNRYVDCLLPREGFFWLSLPAAIRRYGATTRMYSGQRDGLKRRRGLVRTLADTATCG